ncbi:hypothetical protein GU243_03830 [Pseudarthrobacter psychrotolerans]|uniref:Uncharacterized protein n=1 Tax=Pseudarthrobacter psychrotolerans TaxID=2697569 RepID=A0A6P1NJP6_9MICC|nr:hypothetical protein [Pseudarthrobacter psychrotolerans]QHK19027.1 hypothetical protein GU243_03830 [Pseudarthrobacter psychrotolerans]
MGETTAKASSAFLLVDLIISLDEGASLTSLLTAGIVDRFRLVSGPPATGPA